MILVSREKGSKELLPIIQRIGVNAELTGLPYGDFAFEGNGPEGPISIGVERKALDDMLHCIDDARYSAHQKPGMAKLYDKNFLIIEGMWKPHEPKGFLMRGFDNGAFTLLKYRSQSVMYSKLRRYLFSVALSNVIVLQTRDMYHTAYDVCELFHYFSKPWAKHTSLLELQKFALPSLTGKPSLVRQWANALEGIGVTLSEDAERLFKTPIRLAQSSESEWMRLRGVGVATAQKIVREIQGWK